MTTNEGAQVLSRASIGFTQQDHSTDGMEALKKFFSPEFRNRLDAIVQFASLSKDVVYTVVDKFLYQLQTQLDDKRITLNVDEKARDWLITHGYDEKMGARPMARIIQEHIKKPLANRILFGDLVNGGVVNITVADDAGLLIEKEEEEATPA
jgi:ATP-dependent Clp protease ATP-binding subunit ClpA